MRFHGDLTWIEWNVHGDFIVMICFHFPHLEVSYISHGGTPKSSSSWMTLSYGHLGMPQTSARDLGLKRSAEEQRRGHHRDILDDYMMIMVTESL